MKNSRLLSIVLLLLGIAVLVFFSSTVDFSQIKYGLGKLQALFIFFVLFLIFLTLLLKALRWKYLVQATAHLHISWSFAFSSIIAGIAAGSLTPTRAGEIAKPFMIKQKYNINISETMSSVFSERAFDLLSIILLCFVGLLFMPFAKAQYYYAVFFLVLILILIILCLFIFPQRFQRWGKLLITQFAPASWKEKLSGINEKVFAGFAVLRRRDVLAVVAITSLLSMLIEVVRLFFIFKILGLPLNFWLVMFSFAASVVFGLITMIPGGIGTTELSQAAIILALVPAQGNLVKLAILLDRFFSFYLLLGLGGIILMVTQKWKN